MCRSLLLLLLLNETTNELVYHIYNTRLYILVEYRCARRVAKSMMLPIMDRAAGGKVPPFLFFQFLKQSGTGNLVPPRTPQKRQKPKMFVDGFAIEG